MLTVISRRLAHISERIYTPIPSYFGRLASMRIPSLSTMTPAHALQQARGIFYGWKLVGVGTFLLTLMAVSVF
ncbi:MAG TPA: hypothetical protein DC056_12435, partial [Dehalococcoidia bacterium]|nr:hypothetical protein [Dehalococcoidia bacterium]